MRKVILGVAVSLDGFIEDQNGEYDWCFADQDYGMTEFLETIDAIFYGRKSFDRAGGNIFPTKQAFVFTSSLRRDEPGVTFVGGDIIKRVEEIKQKPGKNIWLFGGADLTSHLVNAGLVDEFWLSVHPIILGGGKACFQDIQQRNVLRLMESKSYPTGLVSLKYARA